MRIDLFELIEGLFRGIVYFIYNLVETIGMIVRHPVRGPTRLYRRYRQGGGRQIGGLTFLFVVVLACFSGAAAQTLLDYRDPGGGPAGSIPRTYGMIETDRLWIFFLGTLIATVVIDAVLRLVLRWRLPRRPEWRNMMLASAEFALFWLVVVAFTALSGAATSSNELATVAIIALVPAALPAAIILRRATRRRRPVRARREWPWLLGWAVGLVLLFGTALGVGMTVSDYVGTLQEARAGAPLRIETLDCQVRGGGVEAFGVVTLRGGGPRTIAPSDFRLELYNDSSWDKKMTLDNPGWADLEASPYLLLSPGGAQLIHLRFAAREAPPGETECRLAPSGIERDTARPPLRMGPG